jgi:TolA-binding protein
MSLVTIAEAAKLTNQSTQTLYRHIRSGRLSRESNGKIQIVELIRVYGELSQIEKVQKQTSYDKLQNDNVDVINLLQQQINRLEKDLQNLKTEGLERERQAIEREKRLMALLENQSSRNNSGGLFGKLFK